MIIGIDASSSCTGLSVFDGEDLIFYTKIKPDKKLDFRNNACQVIDKIIPILEKYDVEKIYMEDIPQFVRMGSRGKALTGTLCALGCVQGIFYCELSYKRGYNIEYIDVDEWRMELGFLKGKERKREQQKAKAVEFANNRFGLDLYYVEGKKSVKNDDDIAESICIAYSQIMKKQ